MKAITFNSVVPMRTEPSEQAEMCSQILFAETMTIIEITDKWCKVRLDSDNYEGWVDRKMISTLPDNACEAIQNSPKASIALPVVLAVSKANQTSILLTGGTRLPNYKDGEFELLGIHFQIDPSAILPAGTNFSKENVLNVARFFLNTPYLWGGRNALGMDCSGFTQMMYRIFGIQLPRDASEQVKIGKTVDFLTEAQAGDLAFFENKDHKIIHVGMLMDNQSIMHASGRVKINRIDATGIVSEEDGQHTHQLRIIKRII